MNRNYAHALILVLLAGLRAGSVLAQEKNIENENLVLKTLVVKDSFLNNQPAFSLLIPADWQGEGTIIWRWHTILPATGTMRAWNPNGLEAVRFYAQIPFVDGIRESAAQNAAVAGPQAMQFAASGFPEGGKYMGNEVRRFAGRPVDYLTQILLPRQRPDIKGYKIIAAQDMPKWAQSSSYVSDSLPGMNCTAQAGRVRIEYVENGRAIHEDFFLLLPRLQIGLLAFWGAESASSVRGEAGKLDGLHKLHNTMLSSTKLDLNWFNQEQQVAAVLQDMARRQQQQVMEISQIFRRTSNEISKTLQETAGNAGPPPTQLQPDHPRSAILYGSRLHVSNRVALRIQPCLDQQPGPIHPQQPVKLQSQSEAERQLAAAITEAVASSLERPSDALLFPSSRLEREPTPRRHSAHCKPPRLPGLRTREMERRIMSWRNVCERWKSSKTIPNAAPID
jgi:hypothetical protein